MIMIVRVSLKNADPQGNRIRFDLNVGNAMKPLQNMAYFGVSGALNDTEFSNGVVLRPDGVIDMGCGFERSGRFHKTNLLTKKICIGEYVTVWWEWDVEPSEATYVIEAVTVLSAVTEVVKIPEATSFHIESIYSLPRFRARVVRSFDIEGYDGVIYRPPVGVVGDVAYFQGYCIFCPDDAVSKDEQLITVIVNEDDLELVVDKCDASIMAGL